MFENKTKSEILSKLNIPESRLKFVYMKDPGMGIDLLEALHTIVSPEELFKHGKAFGISSQQLKKLKSWLESNCHMRSTTKKEEIGYGWISRALFDNGVGGILTKIRRYMMNWEPELTSTGKIKYKNFDWLTPPKIILKNEEAIVIKREMPYGAIKRTGNDDFMGVDRFYERQNFVYVKDNSDWRKATIKERMEVMFALEMIEKLVA